MSRYFMIVPMCSMLTLLFASTPAQAQTVNDAGLWTAVFGQGKLNDAQPGGNQLKWWFDGQGSEYNPGLSWLV